MFNQSQYWSLHWPQDLKCGFSTPIAWHGTNQVMSTRTRFTQRTIPLEILCNSVTRQKKSSSQIHTSLERLFRWKVLDDQTLLQQIWLVLYQDLSKIYSPRSTSANFHLKSNHYSPLNPKTLEMSKITAFSSPAVFIWIDKLSPHYHQLQLRNLQNRPQCWSTGKSVKRTAKAAL